MSSAAETPAAQLHRRGILLTLVVGAVLLPAILGSSTTIFNDGDVSWHIATGLWILEQGAIPRTDPFSFTAAGRPWVPIEWLAEVIYGGAFELARYSGVAAVVTLSLVALHLAVVLNGLRYMRPAVIVVLLIAIDAVLIPMLLARPHVIAWALLAWWMYIMLRARERGRAPPLLAALMIVAWANLHGSFVVGLAVAAAFALEALIESRNRAPVVRSWGLFGLACLVAALINANGLSGLLHPFQIGSLEMLPLIDEWKPSNPATTPLFFAVLVAALFIVWRRGTSMSPVRVLLLVGLLVMALLQVRHQAVLAIAAVMILPAGFAARKGQGPMPLFDSSKLRNMTILAVAAAVALPLLIRLIQPLVPPENATNPWRLIAAVPPELRGQPVLNGYVMGGPLILSGIRPYVDGRADMYGDRFVIDYKKISDGDPARFEAAVGRWNIGWTIFPHEKRAIVAYLESSPNWRRVHSDAVGVIHVRNGSPAGPGVPPRQDPAPIP